MVFHFYPRTYSREVASIKKGRGGVREGGGGGRGEIKKKV